MSGYAFYDLLPPQHGMLDEVMNGLALPQKEIQPKYFYDARGCRLFESICDLPEYYPTRTELAIMRSDAQAMAEVLGPECCVIEIGCGNSEKTRLLLEALHPLEFVAVDIAREQLETSCSRLEKSFAGVSIVALRADFARPVALPVDGLRQARRRVLYFPGSTIGNFTQAQAREFLGRWAKTLGPGGGALIGVDLKKDTAVLEAAYNDAQGVTAEFNLNILAHLNHEFGADFDVHAFRHRAFYNAGHSRIEMHLVSSNDQKVTIGGRNFSFRTHETIHTESSCKYSIPEFQELGRAAGYTPVQCWTDDRRLFSVHYFTLPQ